VPQDTAQFRSMMQWRKLKFKAILGSSSKSPGPGTEFKRGQPGVKPGVSLHRPTMNSALAAHSPLFAQPAQSFLFLSWHHAGIAAVLAPVEEEDIAVSL